MAEINYRFNVEKLVNVDANTASKLRERYHGNVWAFDWPKASLVNWMEGAYEILVKAIKLAPEERGFELLIDGKDLTITLTPYSERTPPVLRDFEKQIKGLEKLSQKSKVPSYFCGRKNRCPGIPADACHECSNLYSRGKGIGAR